MSNSNAIVMLARASVVTLTLLVGVSGCAVDAVEQAEGSESAESVDSRSEAVSSGHILSFRNLATQFCLDSNGSGSVYTSGCYYSGYQAWVIDPGKVPGYFLVRNKQTGRCLDSNANGATYANPCSQGNSYQNWKIGNTPGKLENLVTSRVLDSNTSRAVYTLPANGGNFQRWEMFCLNSPCLTP